MQVPYVLAPHAPALVRIKQSIRGTLSFDTALQEGINPSLAGECALHWAPAGRYGSTPVIIIHSLWHVNCAEAAPNLLGQCKWWQRRTKGAPSLCRDIYKLTICPLVASGEM